MSKDNIYSIIVMYTFHEKNNNERESFRESLKQKFETEQLDESTYAIRLKDFLKKVLDELKAFCKDFHFDEGEFVSMYYACALDDGSASENYDKIQRVQIGGYNL